jgi:Tfp pilus assembly protein PilX
MILVIISVIGIAAMRTSLFGAKVATSAQASAMAFQSAETALAAIYDEATTVPATTPGHVIAISVERMITGNPAVVDRCVTVSGAYEQRACGSGDYADSRELTKAESRTVVKPGGRAVKGSGIGSTSGTTVRYYDFLSAAKGAVPVLNINRFNVQEYTIQQLTTEPEI